MGQMNKAWHARNPTADRATFEERRPWHERHAKACGCRQMPVRTAAELAKRKKMAAARTTRRAT